MQATTTPRIYVACLASYNAGRLYGRWIDAAQDAETIREEIDAMLKASPIAGAEEYAIHDYEGFNGTRLSEYESIETVATLAELLEEHGEPFGVFYANDTSRDLDGIADEFEELYCGEWDSEQAYAEDYVSSTGMLAGVDEDIASYFDYGKFARDMFMGDYWASPAGGGNVYVFRSY